MSLYQELKRRNVLRVGAAYLVFSWLVIQVVETLFPVYGLSDAAIRLVVSVLAVGLVPVLVLAWVYEITPEGLKRESEVDRSRALSPHTGRRLDRVIMVTLALALTLFAADKFVVMPQRDATLREQQAAELERVRTEAAVLAAATKLGERSIAVLPFEDMSAKGDQEYLGDGLAEELLNLLAAIPELQVISRTSAFAYKGRSVNLAQVGKELGVRHVLEGSVRSSGDIVRITAQLIDTRTDTHLWSKTYDRALDDLFAVQDDIAAAVVSQLRITLLGEVPTVRKVNPDAYALYLRGRALTDRNNPDSEAEAEALFRRALEIDPSFARAWVSLANLIDRQMREGEVPVEEGIAMQQEWLDTALRLAPELGSVYASRGWLDWVWRNDLKAAAANYARAVSLDPGSSGIAGSFLFTLGRVNDSLPFFEIEARSNPVSATAHSNLGTALIYAGEIDRGIAELDTALILAPEGYGLRFLKGLGLMLQGRPAEALPLFDAELDETYRAHGQAIAHYELGHMDAYQEAFNRLVEREQDAYSSEIALVCAWVGNADCAFYWMEQEWAREGSSGWAQFPSNPHLARIEDDPRWLPFLEKVGIAPAQLAEVRFEAPVAGL